MSYFSIRFSVICIVDDGIMPEDGYTLDIQVRIVKANSFDEAVVEAIKMGKQQECSYKNDRGNDVFWRFKEIEHIRKLGDEITDIEISSRYEGYYPDEILNAKKSFIPEKSEPTLDEAPTI